MTFDELSLCIAIQKAGRCPDTPRTSEQRTRLAIRVFNEWVRIRGESCFPFTIDQIVGCDTMIRKNKDTRTKVAVAQKHGTTCFWEGRDKGPCCDTVECGHLWQNSKGGPLSVANCVIECRSHNNQRRAMGVEEYIKSSLRTGSLSKLPGATQA
jgi:hypothetical protein